MQNVWQVTAQNGTQRGVCWTVEERPLILGRSLSCDIVVSDPTVSRRHCEIACDGNGLRFRDLGSRNVTLHNGHVADKGTLAVGDELSIGNYSFIVTRAMSPRARELDESVARTDDTTLSLGTPVYLGKQAQKTLPEEYPATAREMVLLYQLNRRLSEARAMADMVTQSLAALRKLFPDPARVRVCIVGESGAMTVHPEGAPFSPRAQKLVERSVRQNSAMLKLERKLIGRSAAQIAVAPLDAGPGAEVAFVVMSAIRERMLEEIDLARLNNLAAVVTPHARAFARSSRQSDRLRKLTRQAVVGKSEAAARLRNDIETAATSRLNVLVSGESGTGKVHVAELIHQNSPEPRGALIVANCDALAGASFSNALLGEERPARSGGVIVESGLLDRANGGTLVLREIGALDRASQRLLNRVLRAGSFARLGSTAEVSFHGRIISTTCQDLEIAVQRGRFDSELLARLSRLRMAVAPLRQRRADIRSLAQHFVRNESERLDSGPVKLTDEALSYLEELPLSGNASELERRIATAARQGDGRALKKDDLRAVGDDGNRRGHPDLSPLEHAEQSLIAAVVRQCGGDVARAADILGLTRIEVERVALHLADGKPRVK